MTLNNEIPQVIIEGDKICVTSLVVVDRTLAAYMEMKQPEERLKVMEQALRIGLMALQSAVGSIDVDHVGRAVEKLIADTKESNKKAIEEVKKVFEDAFKKDGGTMPAGLEKFLGDEGELAEFTKKLFDPKWKESAFGRLGTFMEEWIGGQESKLGIFLNPDREGSTFHQFRKDIFGKIDAILNQVSVQKGMKVAQKKGTQKGVEFESRVIQEYTEMLLATGDSIEGTGTQVGSKAGCKTGDAVITVNPINPFLPRFRIVVEVKDTKMSERELEDELALAKENRDSEIALMIFSLDAARNPNACFELHRHGIICAVDPEIPDTAILRIGYRLAKIYAEVRQTSHAAGLDLSKLQFETKNIQDRLKSFANIRKSLTSINDITEKVREDLEVIEREIVDTLSNIEGLIRQAPSVSN